MEQCDCFWCLPASARRSAWQRLAQADPNGDFLAALDNSGITYHHGPDAIGIGQRACQLMDQRHPEADVIKGMTEQKAGFTINGATKFVQIAEKVYCPQHIGGVVQPPPPQPAPNSPPPFSHGRCRQLHCRQVASF
jgi:Protein of unknown function (DUF732)